MTAKPSLSTLSAAITEKVKTSPTALPTPPTMIGQLLGLIADDRTRLEELAEVVSKDPGLATRVLSAANSALYRMGSPATSLQQAVSRLGMRGLRGIALGLAANELGGKSYPELRQRCWRHCLAVGAATKLLARHARASASGDFFVFGLLHNVGELVALQVAGRMKETAGADEGIVTEAIQQANAGCGQALFTAWGLPEVISNLHMLCHGLREADGPAETRVAQVVQLADAAARAFELGPHDEAEDVLEGHPAIAALGLSQYQVCDLEVELIDMVLELNDALS